ncbi:hypothetical protein HQ346_19750 [Rhodococcus sp. BP-252]|uniref:hypothetical protein n=1 Tax=unclassified Rhodococcus (in: high G+C Gram-positive bacteria) TaxID=192944 RepID=UPI001C9B3865|nr:MULTISPECIES: hypothetical protein [unclassified Rhodococcus (in: high G+C Gram-positive bacteria)]MBY6413933.1 hypothetical protein [Rhodococcus sp. BP-320]MBY6418617.1 hypothetical protein [Rhodococcus sp. BP-321]MBY6422912.1 hypothetical protein [Rhodococcus sp. BP-324]MBY6428739.1 hypothetical protein [Rhodococcus sp. BP-323]MBY6433738.1 hypothetical protein [Rhodococcus sp. BP-322]
MIEVNGDSKSRRFDALLEAYLDTGVTSGFENASDDERRELDAVRRVVEALRDRAYAVPALDNDPVAQMLGLVPKASKTLNPVKLQAAMKSTGMKASEIASRLASSEWEVSTRDVFNWSAKNASMVPPALIDAIAKVLAVTPDSLVDVSARESVSLRNAELGNDPLFANLAVRWAKIKRVTEDVAAAMLLSRLDATVYRGETPPNELLLRSLEALVSASEKKSVQDES